jgi:hypothetical protein
MSEIEKEEEDPAIELERKGRLEYEKLKKARFIGNNMPSWRPHSTSRRNFILFTIFGGLFLVFGIFVLIESYNIVEYRLDYTTCSVGKECNLDFKIPEIWNDPPYLIYYNIQNFHQNHKRYVGSRSFKQLSGNRITHERADDDCSPIITMGDVGACKNPNF